MDLFLAEKKTPREIANKTGIKYGIILRDISIVRKQWKKNSDKHIEKIKHRDLAELDAMERQVATGFLDHIEKDPELALKFFDRRIKVKERRAILLGMDAKTQTIIAARTNESEIGIFLDR
jgi:hypothetical protein|tara:strand:+ start:206 stop:568 length:363 start_codon:yes stop_codon:yes gene_type:complete